MQLRASLTARDLAGALVKLAPIRLHFTEQDDDTRWVELDRPDEALLVEEGLRLSCTGRLRYTIQRFPLELELNRIQLLIRPQVLEPGRAADRLHFHIRVEDLDIRYVPGVLDSLVTQTIDKAITPRTTQLVWMFGKTLSHRFQMPSRMEPIEHIGLEVTRGRFDVSREGVELVVDFAELDVGRSSARPRDD